MAVGDDWQHMPIRCDNHLARGSSQHAPPGGSALPVLYGWDSISAAINRRYIAPNGNVVKHVGSRIRKNVDVRIVARLSESSRNDT